MAYASPAIDAVSSAPAGASVDAAAIEAAYDTLNAYFGIAASDDVCGRGRANDADRRDLDVPDPAARPRRPAVSAGVTSAQTPWVGNVRPFVLQSAFDERAVSQGVRRGEGRR
jgi:hypothetical protein